MLVNGARNYEWCACVYAPSGLDSFIITIYDAIDKIIKSILIELLFDILVYFLFHSPSNHDINLHDGSTYSITFFEVFGFFFFFTPDGI